MILVIDNNIFSYIFKAFTYSYEEGLKIDNDNFNFIWFPLSELLHDGILISVDEVYCELMKRFDKEDEVGDWLRKHKKFFLKPNNDEGFIMKEIFKNKKFREGVKEKSLLAGYPEADAFIIAKAKYINGIVVTGEKDYSPNSEKIPNIAEYFCIPYITKNSFYKLLKNKFNSVELLNGVEVNGNLQHISEVSNS